MRFRIYYKYFDFHKIFVTYSTSTRITVKRTVSEFAWKLPRKATVAMYIWSLDFVYHIYLGNTTLYLSNAVQDVTHAITFLLN